MYVTHAGKIVFIRVPKTGSTSVLNAIRAKWPDLQVYRRPHLKYSEAGRCGDGSYYRFGCIRHPLDWLRSMYDSIHKGESHRGLFTDSRKASKCIVKFLEELKYTPYDWLVNRGGKLSVIVHKTEEYAELEDRLGISIPRHNVTESPTVRFRYNSETEELLRAKFSREFKHYLGE